MTMLEETLPGLVVLASGQGSAGRPVVAAIIVHGSHRALLSHPAAVTAKPGRPNRAIPARTRDLAGDLQARSGIHAQPAQCPNRVGPRYRRLPRGRWRRGAGTARRMVQ